MYPETDARPAATAARRDAIRISGLVRRHRGRNAIDGVDLTVPAGQVVAVLGPAGAGKSTLVELLLGLSVPDAGEVSIHGRPPRTAIRAGRIGAMLQQGTLLDDCTVHETVAMIAALHRTARPVTEALILAGVADVMRRRCAGLSESQRQQVRFAVALAGDPDLIVLDEPTAAMDAAARRGFWSAVRVLGRRGTTVLITARALTGADASADRVVDLRAGRIVAAVPVPQQ